MKQIKFNFLFILIFIIFLSLIWLDYYCYTISDNSSFWGLCQVFWIPLLMWLIDFLERKYKTFTKISKWLTKERIINFK